MRSRLLLLLARLTVAGVAAACSGVGETDEQVATVTDSAAIIDWETFRASARAIPNRGLLVEGDLLFQSEQELYEYWLDELSGIGGQALTVNRTVVNGVTVDDIWAFPKRLNLTYCIGTNFPPPYNMQIVSALESAVLDWTRIAAVRFERKWISDCDSNNTSVDFDVTYVPAGEESGLCGRGFYPSQNRAGTHRTLEMGEDAFIEAEHCNTLESTLLHELGHIMGFRHEHLWGTMAGDGCQEGNQNKRLIPYPNDPLDPFVAHDKSSIMHYSWCGTPAPGASWPGTLSIRDRFGAALLYGLAPFLTSSIASAIILN